MIIVAIKPKRVKKNIFTILKFEFIKIELI